MSYNVSKIFYSSLKSEKSSKISIFYVFSRFQSPIFTFEGSIKTKKSPSAYIYASKNCFRCRAIMMFVSAGTYDNEEIFINLLHHSHVSKNFLRRTNSSEISQKTLLFASIWTILALKVVWKGMKLKKSPSPYVFANKNCSGCRAIMLFASAGTYGHEEVFTNLLHHCHCSFF